MSFQFLPSVSGVYNCMHTYISGLIPPLNLCVQYLYPASCNWPYHRGHGSYMAQTAWGEPSVTHYVHLLNILMAHQNGQHFAQDILKCILLNENLYILIQVPSHYLNECLLTYSCITGPQWVLMSLMCCYTSQFPPKYTKQDLKRLAIRQVIFCEFYMVYMFYLCHCCADDIWFFYISYSYHWLDWIGFV